MKKPKDHPSHATASVTGPVRPVAAAKPNELELPPRRNIKSAMVSVRLDETALADLEKLAEKQGIGVSTLIRMWTLQRLAGEAPRTGEDVWA
jgi:hypothetical protein